MKWWKPVVVGLSLTLAPGMMQPALAGKKDPQPKAVKMPSWTELAQKQPAAYDKATPEARLSEEQLADWWKTFQDPKLDALIELSLKNNRDLQAAQARVEEARAQLGISKGEALPWLNVGGTYGRYEAPQGVNDKISDMSPYPGMINPPNRNSSVAGLGIDASWEPDFFGRLKAKKQSAAHNLAAQHAALYSTWVTLSAETALNYVSLRTLQQDLDLLERHAALEGEKADLLQTNYNAGLISGYPLEAMRTQEQNTRAEIPRTRQSIQETLTRLSILTGTEPGQLNDLLEPEDLPEIDPELYHAIPANL
ncbi:TolC family protein, partial [Acidaminococcus sp. CAG:542]